MSRLVYGVGPVRELVRGRAAQVAVVYVALGDTGPAIKELHEDPKVLRR